MNIILYIIQQIALMIQFCRKDITYLQLIQNIINAINVEHVKKIVPMAIPIVYHALMVLFYLH